MELAVYCITSQQPDTQTQTQKSSRQPSPLEEDGARKHSPLSTTKNKSPKNLCTKCETEGLDHVVR